MSLRVFSKIDEGSFGKIFVSRKIGGIDHNKTYVIKIVRSDSESSYNEHHRICCNELKMFKLVQQAPFFVQLKYSCKTRHEYHFVMDFALAGNLFKYMETELLSLAEAKMCCAEIVLALEYLHKHNVAYRDLKLENILISADGHILLTDFGLARKIRNNSKLFDKAGTLAYFAPEMIGTGGHSFEVDWWALGIVLFELLVGHSPFLLASDENPSENDHCYRILKDEPHLRKLESIRPRSEISESLFQFIKDLLIKDPQQRLGSGHDGYQAVKQHAFFRPLNWLVVRQKAYKCLRRTLPVPNIRIDYAEEERIVSLEEPQEQSRKEFYFVAPEMNAEPEFYLGAEPDDGRKIGKRISPIKPITSVQLTQDLFIRTFNVADTIKKIIIPKKSVRFAEISTDSVLPKAPNRSRVQQDERFSPYGQKFRRSNRIASRRMSESCFL